MRALLGILLVTICCNVFAIVVNAGTQNLYLGNNNVSCGRYIINNSSRQNDVESFCSVIGSAYAEGKLWLRVQTQNLGAVDCSFISGHLYQCFIDN